MSEASRMKILMEAMNVFEGYEDRVREEVNKIFNSFGAVSKEEFLGSLFPPEKRLGGAAWKDYQKDALAYASKIGAIKRKSPSGANRFPYYTKDKYGQPVGISKEDIGKLGYKMMEWAGESFPDGDPNDRLWEYIEKKGWDPHTCDKIIAAACKNVLGTKDYYEYLADLWDDVYGYTKYDTDTSGLGYSDERPPKHMNGEDMMRVSMGGEHAKNPWRSTK